MTYGYTDTKWKDLLTSYDGQTITYDAIGNPLSYYNGNTYTLTWSHGRQLTQLSKQQTISPLVATYTYDESGLRTSKTVGSATTEYHWDGNLLVGTTGQYGTLQFLYDGGSQPYGVLWNGAPYYYVYNGQGDVVRIVNEAGATKVIYTYDAWGRQLSQKNANGNSIPSYATSEIANANPLRYRGYIYDIESGFYYLQSRYYDPTVGRLINADAYVSTGQGLTGTNMFAYCGNNPVSRIDTSGTFFKELGGFFKNVGEAIVDGVKAVGDVLGDIFGAQTTTTIVEAETKDEMDFFFFKISKTDSVSYEISSAEEKPITAYADTTNYNVGIKATAGNISGNVGIGLDGINRSASIDIQDTTYSLKHSQKFVESEISFSAAKGNYTQTYTLSINNIAIASIFVPFLIPFSAGASLVSA